MPGIAEATTRHRCPRTTVAGEDGGCERGESLPRLVRGSESDFRILFRMDSHAVAFK